MKRIDYSKINVEDFLNELGIRNVMRDGPEVRYSCPFEGHNHGDANPSASMRINDTVYNCFGCGARGNALTFLCEYEGISPYDAAIKLRTLTGDWAVDSQGEFYTEIMSKLDPKEKIRLRVQPSYQEVYDRGIDWHTVSNESDGAPEEFLYLLKRGFTPDILARFEIGWDSISQRLTIPYFSDDGKEILGFKGRTPYSDVIPRYKVLGGPEYGFDTFDVSKTLFAIDKIRPCDKLIVCEGELNCISMRQKGFENVVSISGQFVSDEQVYLISKYARKVILIFDEIEKALKAADGLMAYIPVEIVDEHKVDPADLHVIQLRQLVDSAKSALIIKTS